MSFTPQERRLLALSDRVEARPYRPVTMHRIVAALTRSFSIAATARALHLNRGYLRKSMKRLGVTADRKGDALVITVKIKGAK